MGDPGDMGVAAGSYSATLDAIPIQPTCTPLCPPFSTHARLFLAPTGHASSSVLIASENGLEPASSVAIVTLPSHGEATASGNVLTYTPTSYAEFPGVDAFEFNACRSAGGCRSGFAVVQLPEPGLLISLAGGIVLLAALRSRPARSIRSCVRSCARSAARG
jgi:hypothetical protein